MLEWINGGNTEPSTIAKSTYCPLRTLIIITKIFDVQLSRTLVLRQWDKACQLASQEHLIWRLLDELGLSCREILLPLCKGPWIAMQRFHSYQHNISNSYVSSNHSLLSRRYPQGIEPVSTFYETVDLLYATDLVVLETQIVAATGYWVSEAPDPTGHWKL